MTSYVTIPNGDVDAESPLDVDLMTALRDNPTAITEGATGAPKIQTAALEQTGGSEAVTAATIRAGAVDQTAIASSAVGQAELKTTTASQSVLIGPASYQSIVPTGGTYSLYCYRGGSQLLESVSNNLTYSATMRFLNTDTGNQNAYVYSRYVQASPPYDLGNGDIALFIMAKINKATREILATEIAPDPFWAYHGPHDIHPINGKLQKAVGLWGIDVMAELESIARDSTLAKLADMRKICNDPDLLCRALAVDFTMEEKNIDMNIAPHGFGKLAADEMVVMIDPVGSLTDQLALLHESSEVSVSDLLHSGSIVIGNPLDAITPAGITPVSASWKSTG